MKCLKKKTSDVLNLFRNVIIHYFEFNYYYFVTYNFSCVKIGD